MLPISIVIPTYNRVSLLMLCLPTYISQNCAEIIIVDDASSPPVIDLLYEKKIFSLVGDGNIRVVRNDRRCQQPRSRMIGVEHSSQPYVFFGEDDAYLSDNHITTLWNYLQAGIADIVAGPWLTTQVIQDMTSAAQRAPVAFSLNDVIDMKDFRIFTHRIPAKPIRVPFLHTLALMSKKVVEQIRFDPCFRGNAFREETDFYLRALAAGWRLALVPSPPAFHYKGILNIGGGQQGAGGVLSLLWYEYWVVRNNIYFLRKHRDLLYHLFGLKRRPVIDTFCMLGRRALGYPGRIKAYILPQFITRS